VGRQPTEGTWCNSMTITLTKEAMMKVYVVQLYEDIYGVFDSEEKAKQWIIDNEPSEDWREKYSICPMEVQK